MNRFTAVKRMFAVVLTLASCVSASCTGVYAENAEPEISKNRDTFSVTVVGENGKSGRAAFFIAKKGKSTEGMLNASDYLYVDFSNDVYENGGKTFSYSFKDVVDASTQTEYRDYDPYGEYSIKFVLTPDNEAASAITQKFYFNSEATWKECVDAFVGVASYTDFEGKRAIYGEATGNHVLEDGEVSGDINERFFDSYELMRPVFQNEKYGLKLEWNDGGTVSDVLNLIKSSVLVDGLLYDNKTDAEVKFNKYQSSMDKFLRVDDSTAVDFNKFYGLFDLVSGDITSRSNKNEATALLEKYIRRCAAVSYMLSSSPSQIKNILDECSGSDILNVDLKYATDKGVALLGVASKIDEELENVSNRKKYIEDFDAQFKRLTDDIVKKPGGSINSKPGGSSVGGSSGGGSKGGMSLGALPKTDTSVSVSGNDKPGLDKANPFEDLKGFEWAEEYINECYQKGVVSGKSSNAFEPGAYITREEFIKMAVGAFNVAAISQNEPEFDDVNPDEWYYKYIYDAYNAAVINGIDERRFGVGEYISREDIAAILFRIKHLADGEKTVKISDYDKVSDYAQKAVNALASNGIINGYDDDSFRPSEFATRAEVCTIIVRFLKVSGGI